MKDNREFKTYHIPNTSEHIITTLERVIRSKFGELAFRYDNCDGSIQKSLDFWKKVDDGTKGNIPIKLMKLLEETNEFLAACSQLVTKGVKTSESFLKYRQTEGIEVSVECVDSLKAEFIDMLNAGVQYAIVVRNTEEFYLTDIIDIPHDTAMGIIAQQVKSMDKLFHWVPNRHEMSSKKFFSLVLTILDEELDNQTIFEACKAIIERKTKEINV